MGARRDLSDEVLMSLRRITRAIDLHSRRLVQSHGLTGPQALLLKRLLAAGKASVGTLAQHVNLSQATVTDILNRLEQRGLVRRIRSTVDRRRVNVEATEEASRLLQNARPLLQEQFAERFNELHEWEQTLMLAALRRVSAMMDARDLAVSPVLTPGPIPPSPDSIDQMEHTVIAPAPMRQRDA